MSADEFIIACGYKRLSREEEKQGEFSSIKTQRSMISDYCRNHNINLVKFFIDDGWSGGNFDRPGFQDMMQELENGVIYTVITKDLSRPGRFNALGSTLTDSKNENNAGGQNEQIHPCRKGRAIRSVRRSLF